MQKALWEAGKKNELAWWRKYLEHNIRDQIEDEEYEEYKDEEYKHRFDPDQPLQDWITEKLSASQGATVSILDVGAGPATLLGKRWKGRTVEITAVDPLADDYNHLLDALGLTPPLRTQEGEVERLTDQFSSDYFDLVTMQNALDHSYDPITGIRQMLDVVKPGSYVVLHHYVNEGVRGGYQGLHQWNFCADNGHFIIWNRQTRVSVTDAIGDVAQITVDVIREWETPFADKSAVEVEQLFVSLRKI